MIEIIFALLVFGWGLGKLGEALLELFAGYQNVMMQVRQSQQTDTADAVGGETVPMGFHLDDDEDDEDE